MLVDRATPAPNDVDGIRNAGSRAAMQLDGGDQEGAARTFIDFWMGEGSFDAMAPERRAPVIASVNNVRRWKHAAFTDPVTVADLAALTMPALCLSGSDSPASGRSVSDLVESALPSARRLELAGVGHMGPVTHPDAVNEAIERFLVQVAL